MTPTKPLPSDEERALEIAGPHLHGAYNLDFTGRECGVPDCSWKKRVQAIVALLAQVRAEASQEKRCHNVRGEDGPCDCAGCRDIDALLEENARLRGELERPKHETLRQLADTVERYEKAEQENAALRERVIEAARDHGPLYLHEIEALLAHEPAPEKAPPIREAAPWARKSQDEIDRMTAKAMAPEPAPEKEANRE